MSDLYEISRAVRDVQSRMSGLDHKLSKAFAPSERGQRRRLEQLGQQLVQRAAVQLARASGESRLADVLEKTAVAPAMTDVAGWALELSAVGLPGFILSLERQSALAAILTRSPQVSLLGRGAMKVPVAAAAPPARIIAEGAPIPVLKGSFSPLDLVPFKLAAIMHFSKELAAASVIENAVRTLLSQSIAAGIDAIAFGSTLPGGLLNSVTPTAASTATPLETAMREDFENLITALNAPSADVVFVMSPSHVCFASATLPPSFMYPIVASSAVATSTVVAVDCAGVAAAMSGEPRIAVSENAAVHEEDTTPLALGMVGSPNVVAAPLRGTFQTDTALLRIIADVAWAARPGAVASITTVAW